MPLSLYERAVIRQECMKECKTALKGWSEGRFRAVLDNGIGQMEFYHWMNRMKEGTIYGMQKTLEDMKDFEKFCWDCFQSECIDYFTGLKSFD